MITQDLTATIDTMASDKVEQLLQLFADTDLTITQPPCAGLVMLAVHDSFNTAFHPGEVLVTEARVKLCGCQGFGMVTGEEPRRALARAAADAALNSPGPCPVRDRVRRLLATETVRQASEELREATLAAATRVEFDLMAGA
jgi:alpha-D-ribose 1-methylphosphonate 5-triphosphate synthase subunit PhnG